MKSILFSFAGKASNLLPTIDECHRAYLADTEPIKVCMLADTFSDEEEEYGILAADLRNLGL